MEKRVYQIANFVSQITEQNIIVERIIKDINTLFCRGQVMSYTDTVMGGADKMDVMNELMDKNLRETVAFLKTAVIGINDAVKFADENL